MKEPARLGSRCQPRLRWRLRWLNECSSSRQDQGTPCQLS
jgi:hypothetical protein